MSNAVLVVVPGSSTYPAPFSDVTARSPSSHSTHGSVRAGSSGESSGSICWAAASP